MSPAELIVLFSGTGWVAAAMFAAVLIDAPGGVRARVGGWLVVGALLRALEPILTGLPDGVMELSAAMAWWEAARQRHNSGARRPVSALWHAIPLELLALNAAVELGLTASTRPAWFWPVELLTTASPLVLGALALLWWWRAEPVAGARRAAGVAFAFACALPTVGAWSAPVGLSLAWLAAAGLGAIALAQPAARSRAAGFGFAGFLLAAAAVPFGAALAANRADRALQAEWGERALQVALGQRTPGLAELGGDTPVAVETARRLHRAVADLRATDSTLRDSGVWRLRSADGRIERLTAAGNFEPDRLSTSAERMGEARSEPFVLVPEREARAAAVAVHAPLLATRFESPVAWVALEYPVALHAARLAAARQTAVAGLALLAVGCAGGFVLVTRQAREAAQRGELERAQAADRAKTEFLAFLGHELRTPLQVILGRAEQLAQEESPAGRLHATGVIATHGRLMLRLVNDLLDLGTLQAGRLVLQTEPLALRGLIATAAESARAAAAAKGLVCTVHVEAAVGETVQADEARLLQVLGNLLGNAVKYTKTGGVDLRVEQARPGVVRFRVRDTGIGLPPDKIGRLFTLFTRLDSGASFTREGTGVGLALVQRLVVLMGGTVRAANRPDGPGAEFTVELPLAPATEVVVRPTAANAGPAATGLRVLVAEDHPAVGELLADYLRALGHEPVVVADGPAALAAARTGKYAAVLLDINLPGLDGIALARELAKLTPRPRLIGCSAEVLPETQAAARAAGMDEFLAKPVNREDLRRALAAVAGPARDLFAVLQGTTAGARAREIALAGLPATRAALDAALAAGDAEAIHRHAHYLKNTALVLGDAKLAAEAARAEKT